MKALVVGSNGFLGSHLVAKLLAREAQVSVWNRTPKSQLPLVESFVGVFSETDKLQAALQGVKVVFHLAWTTVPQTSNDDPLWDVQSNVATSLQLLDACVAAGVRTVIFPSSGGTVYGLVDREILDESAPTEPICSYGVTKLAVEKYLALYRRLHGLDYRVLRIANAYGEGQPTNGTQGLIGVTLDKAARRQPIAIWGDGSATRDYVYADDVTESFIKAALVELPSTAPRLFNISSQQGISINELMEAVKEITGLALQLSYTPARICDVDRVVLSNRRAVELLEWVPQITLKAGLSRTWNWLNHQHSLEAAA